MSGKKGTGNGACGGFPFFPFFPFSQGSRKSWMPEGIGRGVLDLKMQLLSHPEIQIRNTRKGIQASSSRFSCIS
jgi:hypothetical protein